MRRSRKIILALIAYASIVACANFVPRKGWNPNLGPVVPHDTFPADCALCHESGSWNKLKADFTFDHEAKTGVALNGAHAQAQCLRCHNDRGPVRAFSEKGCRGCHEDVHRGRLGALCEQCHNEDTWKPLQVIAEHARTRFPLIGGHAAVDCTACHPNASDAIFENASIECESCHAKDVTRSQGFDHVLMGLTEGCDRCHTPVAWIPAGFDHPASFPLTLGHSVPSCADCHTTPGVFVGLSTDCVSCHLPDYQATTNPNHASAGFSTDCATCHTTAQWPGGTFAHPASFPLTQAHAAPTCSACHTTPGVFVGLSTDCLTCHLPNYQATTNPNHIAAGFPTTCAQCHTPTLWANGTFVHPASFPLTQAHAAPTCSACHTTPGVFVGLSTDCLTCHLPNYQATTNPNHIAAGFPTTCAQCHTPTLWANGTFVHPPSFPLTNAHAIPPCSSCHTTPGVFTGLTTACLNCHQNDYQRGHNSQGVSTNCRNCHNTTAW